MILEISIYKEFKNIFCVIIVWVGLSTIAWKHYLLEINLMAQNLFIWEIHNSRYYIKVSQLHFPPFPHPKEKIGMDYTRLAKHWHILK